jgi:hypothetical protein
VISLSDVSSTIVSSLPLSVLVVTGQEWNDTGGNRDLLVWVPQVLTMHTCGVISGSKNANRQIRALSVAKH